LKDCSKIWYNIGNKQGGIIMGWENIMFIVIGAFTILIGISGIGLNTRKAQRLVRLIGETGTRIFYGVLGIGLILMGIFIDFAQS
jgi:small neutral amino acid transporter SnatA (MarC family)